MLLGALAAIGQTNIKRLMAYSSIGHMGYALIGLAAGTEAGVAAMLIYMVDLRVHDARHLRLHHRHAPPRPAVETIADLAGLARSDPALALALAVFMFSMAGIPPLSGFFGKLYVFSAAVQSRPVDAGGDRRADQRDRRLLLSARHQGDVFRCGRCRRSIRMAGVAVASSRPARACSPACSSFFPGAVRRRGRGGGEGAVRVIARPLGVCD